MDRLLLVVFIINRKKIIGVHSAEFKVFLCYCHFMVVKYFSVLTAIMFVFLKSDDKKKEKKKAVMSVSTSVTPWWLFIQITLTILEFRCSSRVQISLKGLDLTFLISIVTISIETGQWRQRLSSTNRHMGMPNLEF